MQALLARLRRMDGLRQVSLAVATTQHAARRLYDGTGFVVYGVEPRALRIGEAFVDDEQRVLMLD
jgi:ribosomal protein S18 acetylase RimI-like enzyme